MRLPSKGFPGRKGPGIRRAGMGLDLTESPPNHSRTASATSTAVLFATHRSWLALGDTAALRCRPLVVQVGSKVRYFSVLDGVSPLLAWWSGKQFWTANP